MSFRCQIIHMLLNTHSLTFHIQEIVSTCGSIEFTLRSQIVFWLFDICTITSSGLKIVFRFRCSLELSLRSKVVYWFPYIRTISTCRFEFVPISWNSLKLSIRPEVILRTLNICPVTSSWLIIIS
jgi:hypothetical protein